jgi:hypothetical protein
VSRILVAIPANAERRHSGGRLRRHPAGAGFKPARPAGWKPALRTHHPPRDPLLVRHALDTIQQYVDAMGPANP